MSAGLFTSVSIPVGAMTDIERLGERAALAEALGIDAVFVTDHPAPPKAWLDRSGHPTLDPFVALAHIAAATATLRVHTNLLVLPYRHPIATAKAVASLDVVSGGRLILGVGVGYLREEFAALGVDHTSRGELMDRALTTMRTAWSGEPFGEHGTVVAPPPTQRPHPPIWIGGNSVAAMRRAVAYGQAWAPMPSPAAAAPMLGTPGIESTADLADRVARFHEMAAAAGRVERLGVAAIPRCLSGFATRAAATDEAVTEIAELRAAGATAVVVSLPESGWDDRVGWLAKEVLGKI